MILWSTESTVKLVNNYDAFVGTLAYALLSSDQYIAAQSCYIYPGFLPSVASKMTHYHPQGLTVAFLLFVIGIAQVSAHLLFRDRSIVTEAETTPDALHILQATTAQSLKLVPGSWRFVFRDTPLQYYRPEVLYTVDQPHDSTTYFSRRKPCEKNKGYSALLIGSLPAYRIYREAGDIMDIMVRPSSELSADDMFTITFDTDDETNEMYANLLYIQRLSPLPADAYNVYQAIDPQENPFYATSDMNSEELFAIFQSKQRHDRQGRLGHGNFDPYLMPPGYEAYEYS